MPRRERIVLPFIPHHLTQRGVRRRQVFFQDSDYETYKRLLLAWAKRAGVTIWAYCLMPNHVHIEASCRTEDGFARALGNAHSTYARRINQREQWAGHLWQGRFYSCALDDPHALHTARYVLMNPVRAGLVRSPEAWPHSSIHAHLGTRRDPLVVHSPLDESIDDWPKFLSSPLEPEMERLIREHTRRRVPLGSEEFVQRLEEEVGRPLRWRPVGRPRKQAKHAQLLG